MKYDLSKQSELDAAVDYLGKLSGLEAIVEIKKVVKQRSGQQNRYLHLTFNIFCSETGYSSEESKILYKRVVNPDLYVYTKNDIPFLRSSKDLTTAEMTKSIDRWRAYAGEQGIEIPLPNDEEALRFWSNEIERQSNYL